MPYLELCIHLREEIINILTFFLDEKSILSEDRQIEERVSKTGLTEN